MRHVTSSCVLKCSRQLHYTVKFQELQQTYIQFMIHNCRMFCVAFDSINFLRFNWTWRYLSSVKYGGNEWWIAQHEPHLYRIKWNENKTYLRRVTPKHMFNSHIPNPLSVSVTQIYELWLIAFRLDSSFSTRSIIFSHTCHHYWESNFNGQQSKSSHLL